MPSSRPRGFTLTEVIVSAAILGVLALIIPALFHINQVTLTNNDARALLKQQAQQTLQRISGNLREARRIYCRQVIEFNSGGNPPTIADHFSSTITLRGYPPLTGTRLPLEKKVSSDSAGNALFFAKQLPSQDVWDGGRTIRIDVYRFYYYYVSEDPNSSPIATKPAKQLYEWKSIPYADANQISQIPAASRTQAIVNLVNTNGIDHAYDISLVKFTDAFYTLTAGGQMNLITDPKIVEAEFTPLTRSSGGRVFSNFRLGICPNTKTLPFATPLRVPQASAFGWTDPSPSGFEVELQQFTGGSGQRGNSLIQIRIVLAVTGPIEKPILQYEDSVYVNVRDIW